MGYRSLREALEARRWRALKREGPTSRPIWPPMSNRFGGPRPTSESFADAVNPARERLRIRLKSVCCSQRPRDAKHGIDKPSHLGRRTSFDQKTGLKRQPFA